MGEQPDSSYLSAPSDEPSSGCMCEACVPFDYFVPSSVRMIVCAVCGNKRCPHATDHRNACTNSNESGQPGSSYQQWKCGDEFLPFHPQASHVPPDYRDGWNRCYWMAVAAAGAKGDANG